jgi:hypothetical protein
MIGFSRPQLTGGGKFNEAPCSPAKAGFPLGSNKLQGIKAGSDLTPLTLALSHQGRKNNLVSLLRATGYHPVDIPSGFP